MSTRRRIVIAVAVIAAVKVAVYRSVVRPWMFHWGSTPDEVDAELPGDELVDGTGPRTTRAVTVDAPPERVWPWVAQMGEDRAGFYSYAWLERLAGCDMHNADGIHPEWQHHAAGETVWLARRYRELGRQVIARIEPDVVFAMVAPQDHEALAAGRRASGAWTFVLQPTDDGRTRLIARGSGGAVGHAAFDVPHFVMEQKMLRGIRARVEDRG